MNALTRISEQTIAWRALWVKKRCDCDWVVSRPALSSCTDCPFPGSTIGCCPSSWKQTTATWNTRTQITTHSTFFHLHWISWFVFSFQELAWLMVTHKSCTREPFEKIPAGNSAILLWLRSKFFSDLAWDSQVLFIELISFCALGFRWHPSAVDIDQQHQLRETCVEQKTWLVSVTGHKWRNQQRQRLDRKSDVNHQSRIEFFLKDITMQQRKVPKREVQKELTDLTKTNSSLVRSRGIQSVGCGSTSWKEQVKRNHVQSQRWWTSFFPGLPELVRLVKAKRKKNIFYKVTPSFSESFGWGAWRLLPSSHYFGRLG